MNIARIALLVLVLALFVAMAGAQTTNATLSISRTPTNVAVAWTGRGTLQRAEDVQGPWRDVLEAPNPFRSALTNAGQHYRAISRWSTRRNLIEANSEMSVAELNGRIYVMGGYPASRVTVRTVQVYDSQLDQWRLTTPLPIPLNHAMPAVVNGRIYLIGGQTTSSGTGSYTNTVFEYDPATSNWTAKASMPTSRSAGAAAVLGNLIYVAGGRPPRGQDFAVYDTSGNTWSTLPVLPTGRNHLAAAAIEGRIYVAGGRLEGGFNSEMTTALEAYDPVARTWSTRAYVAGQNRWYRLESLPVAVHGVTGAAFIDGWIHLPGGGTAVGGSSGSVLHQVFWVGGVLPMICNLARSRQSL